MENLENEAPKEETLAEKLTKMSIRKKNDGTFVIDNTGCPFHLTADYPCGDITVEKINEYIENGGAYEDYVDAIPEVPTEQKISILEQESLKYTSYILAGIDVDLNQQKLLDVMLEIEELKGNLE